MLLWLLSRGGCCLCFDVIYLQGESVSFFVCSLEPLAACYPLQSIFACFPLASACRSLLVERSFSASDNEEWRRRERDSTDVFSLVLPRLGCAVSVVLCACVRDRRNGNNPVSSTGLGANRVGISRSSTVQGRPLFELKCMARWITSKFVKIWVVSNTGESFVGRPWTPIYQNQLAYDRESSIWKLAVFSLYIFSVRPIDLSN